MEEPEEQGKGINPMWWIAVIAFAIVVAMEFARHQKANERRAELKEKVDDMRDRYGLTR